MNHPEIKIMNSDEAVSEVIGYSLILGIVIIAVGILVVIAFPIQSEIQNTAFIESQIQSLTMLDSRISSVALGSTPSQLTRINLNGGIMNVRNDTDNYLKVMVANETGYNITIFNGSLGLIEYKLGDNRLIFENGGMFRIYPNGESVMLSPPEFYFNGETLTFPVIRIANSGSLGGKGTVSVIASSGVEPNIIYPNLSSSLFYNPIYGKQIKIRIKSDNYKAWARYIEERTEAVPMTNDVTKETVVSFNSKPSALPVDLTPPIEVFGIDTTNSTPLTQFNFNLSEVNSNLRMVLRAPTADSEIFVLDVQKKNGCGSFGASIEIRYNKDSANESWDSGSNALCIIQDNNAYIDLLNQSLDMTYNNNKNSTTWLTEAYPNNKTFTKFNGNNGPLKLDVLMQHYMKLVNPSGTFALYQSDNPNEWDGANFTDSTYALTYTILPPNINYLHIVNHEVNITFS